MQENGPALRGRSHLWRFDPLPQFGHDELGECVALLAEVGRIDEGSFGWP